MSTVKPRTMPGVLELLPPEQIAFKRMLDTIRDVYERYAFLPIETPVVELTDVLFTKSGGETEKQVYFVQSTGDRQHGREPDLALRFDLTVPLARYVAEHEQKLQFPFRRYQIQRVYRGESAQRGRYREFYQCDIDVIGRDRLALEHDAEIPAVIADVFGRLNVGDFTIRLNNRRLLRGLLSGLGVGDAETQAAVLREIDKLEKRGPGRVAHTLTESGLDADLVRRLIDTLGQRGSNDEVLAALDRLDVADETFRAGLNELRRVVEMLRASQVDERRFQVDPAIARGLDYYTGTVYETRLDARPEFGSVCSGGRYDDLAGFYTKSKLPGVGISIGATRLFAALLEAGLLKAGESTVKVLVTRLDDTLGDDYLRLAARLRAANVPTEVYAEAARMKKQLAYADKAAIPFAVIMGGDEHARGVAQLKDLRSGEQWEVSRDDLAGAVRERLDRR